MFAAIIFDLDGTAMPSERFGMPSPTMCKAVRDNLGTIKLCAATGRSWRHAKPIIQALGVQELCIISGGSQIIDPLRQTIVWQQTIPPAITGDILNIVKLHPYKVAYAEDLIIDEPTKPATLKITADINAFYILDIPNNDVADTLVHELAVIQSVTVSKAHSWSIPQGIDLHITNSQATKEHAIMELCDRLGVDRQNVAGVGDGYNDIHLFNAVGHKIAMGNAVAELKQAADEVIPSLEDEGLATFINTTAKP